MSAEASDQDLRRRGLGDLLGLVAEDSSLLVRQEIQLAKAEMAEKAVAAGLGVGLIGAALVMLVAGLGAGVTAAIAGFDNLLPLWAAALVVLGAFLLLAVLFLLIGLGRLRAAGPPIPEKAITTAKETPGELIS
jgi:hypothetical protein